MGLGVPLGALETTQGFIDAIRQVAGAGGRWPQEDEEVQEESDDSPQVIARDTAEVLERVLRFIMGRLDAQAAMDRKPAGEPPQGSGDRDEEP